MRKLLCTLLLLTAPAFAADNFAGTFKMNFDKSTGPAKLSDGKLVATDAGAMQSITVTAKAPDGSTVKTAFEVPLQGGEGKIIDGAPYTAVKAKAFTERTSDISFTIDGKPAMRVRSVLSRDGKVMTTTRKVMAGPGTPGRYTDVWERE